MQRQRDTSRSKQYNAETVLRPNISRAAQQFLVNGKKVDSTGNVSIEACQQYVDHVLSSAWFQRRWGRVHITVRHKVSGKATGGHGIITLPPWARDEVTILHEMAHCLTPVSRSGLLTAAHGPEFSAILLELVRGQVGREAAMLLRASYSKNKVKYRDGLAVVPKPTRPVVTRQEQAARAAVHKRQIKERERRETALAQRRLVGPTARHSAAETLRALVKDGFFGPTGSKARKDALATARAMEKGVR